MKTEIYIATHKNYNFPKIEGYVPIHVGKALTALDLGIIGDDTGDNISLLNPNFCELTALYWMWKNSNADILGLVHYRRFFSKKSNPLKIVEIKDIENKASNNIVYLIEKEKVVVRKFKLNFKSTIEKQYKFYHFSKDWDEVKHIILDNYPDYKDALDFVSHQSYASFYNMFIGNKSFLNDYCTWLFSILFELHRRINISQYDSYQARIFGFLSERLLNIFIFHNKEKYHIEYLNKIII